MKGAGGFIASSHKWCGMLQHICWLGACYDNLHSSLLHLAAAALPKSKPGSTDLAQGQHLQPICDEHCIQGLYVHATWRCHALRCMHALQHHSARACCAPLELPRVHPNITLCLN